MYFLLDTHLYPPKSLSIEAERHVSMFWSWDSEDIVTKKLEDRQAYEKELRGLFHNEWPWRIATKVRNWQSKRRQMYQN